MVYSEEKIRVHEPLVKPKPLRLERITTSTQYHTANISYYPKKE